jgi:hypothetical protein
MKVIGKRISILKKEKVLSIVILPTTENAKLGLMFLWLMAWTVCGLLVAINYFKITNPDAKLFIIVYLSFWAYYEFKIVRTFIWKKWGKEKIWVQDGLLHYQREVNHKGKIKEFNPELISELKLIDISQTNFGDFINQSFWVKGGETIEFTYMGKRVTMAMQVSTEEARVVLQELKDYIKI